MVSVQQGTIGYMGWNHDGFLGEKQWILSVKPWLNENGSCPEYKLDEGNLQVVHKHTSLFWSAASMNYVRVQIVDGTGN